MWLVIALIGGVSVTLIAFGSFDEAGVLLRSRLSSMHASAAADLRAASQHDMTAERMVRWALLAALTGFVVGLAISKSIIVALALTVVGFIAPRRWLKRQRRLRLERIEDALPSAVDQMMNSVRAGLSLGQAMEELSRSSTPPISDEFAIMAREIQLGARIGDAITSAQRRIGGRTFPLLATALLTNIEKGGNLPEALQRISDSLKDIWRLEQKLLTASAEARKATRVISAMPIVIALMVMIAQPDLAASMTNSVLGWIILALVAAIYLTGLAWLKRLTESDV